MENKISEFLQTRIDAGDFPSAVYLVAEKGKIAFHDALGHAVVEPERIAATLDTIYDLASLTKPLVTGLLAAKSVEAGEINLDNIVGDYLPELVDFGGSKVEGIAEYDRPGVLVRELLTHRSGYQAWKPLYLLVNSDRPDIKTAVLHAIANRIPPVLEAQVVYSDLNFIMLGGILEMILRNRLDVAASEEIFDPLALRDSIFNPDENVRRRIAASEKGNGYEKSTCVDQGYLEDPAEDGYQDSFRSEVIWGEVHDGNAYFMGGAAGHAGLFATAEDIFNIAQQFLPNYTKLLKPETCEFFITNFTKGMNEDRSFAFQLASTEGSTAGTKMSRESFGHNGFTGTSLWIDPVMERVFVLLTNRTHNHQLPFVNLNSVRRRFHDLSIELLDSAL